MKSLIQTEQLFHLLGHGFPVADPNQRDKTIKSALDSIEKGSEPWKFKDAGAKYSDFGFVCNMKSPCGKFEWSVVARVSLDGRATIELCPCGWTSKKFKKRYGPRKELENYVGHD